MWHSLKDRKGQFIPDLIESFLKLSLLKPQDLRKASLPLVFDVVKCEHTVRNSFKRVCMCVLGDGVITTTTIITITIIYIN